ncbi:unnamed protein product [Brachionus calyciflorus]|uniref:GDP-fucose pyrophosphorylase domain-containing protein n=1 Tax=Brachionus calyciflorus TaxID=104777 RepID=A0A813M3Q8_9BILA|nr:unnamed protein product [Brachionus calyciflorus]
MDRNFLFYENLINGIDFEIDGIKFKKGQKFWDLVVITSISIKQKLCYEKQLDIKLKSNRLPKDINFKVINDPDNCKIGSGGSTLNVIKTLYEVYASELFKMKILLIHAGGYSQRMPSCSVLGKIFSSIPSRSTYINDTFDLKMAIYTPFSVHMKPGIFLTSSDDFETFIFKEQIEASHLFGLNDDEFILLAHKSPLEIAKDHGVYVLNDESPNKNKKNKYSFGYYDCKTVYQKPSIILRKINSLFELAYSF